MSIASPPTRNVAIAPPILMRTWTVEEYHRLIQAGVFAGDERFELLEGWIVPKMSRNPPHDVAMDQTQEQLRSQLPQGWRLRIQSAITTSDSEPEPDIAVVRGAARDYASRHPGPSDLAMIVEVAESSLVEDRRDKARIYARAGIAVYWIINLIDLQLEVFTGPSGPTAAPEYRQRDEFKPSQLAPLVIDGRHVGDIPVRDLLP